jgi:transcriptional regulator with XRE-family HTH domain
MCTTSEVLDRLKAEFGISSDYATAKLLGVNKATISNYRHGKRKLDTTVAYRAAKLLNSDPVELLTKLNKERAANEDERQVWDEIDRLCTVRKSIKNQEFIAALRAASENKLTKKHREILKRYAEHCILCKIAEKPKNSRFKTLSTLKPD